MRTVLLTACAALCLAAAPSLAPAKAPPVAAKKKKSCKPMAEANGCKLKKAIYSIPDLGGISVTVGSGAAPWKTELGRWCPLRDGGPVPFRIASNTAPTIGRSLTLTTFPKRTDDLGTYAGSATATFAAKSVKVRFAMSISYDGSEQCSLGDSVTLKRTG